MMPIDDLKDTSQNKCNSQDICQCEVFANGSATRPNQYRLCKRFWRSAGLRNSRDYGYGPQSRNNGQAAKRLVVMILKKWHKMTDSSKTGDFNTSLDQRRSCHVSLRPAHCFFRLPVADSIANWIILLRVPKKLNVAFYSLFCRAFELPKTKYEDFHLIPCRLGFMCVGGGCLCSLLGSLLLRSSIGGWHQQ